MAEKFEYIRLGKAKARPKPKPPVPPTMRIVNEAIKGIETGQDVILTERALSQFKNKIAAVRTIGRMLKKRGLDKELETYIDEAGNVIIKKK